MYLNLNIIYININDWNLNTFITSFSNSWEPLKASSDFPSVWQPILFGFAINDFNKGESFKKAPLVLNTFSSSFETGYPNYLLFWKSIVDSNAASIFCMSFSFEYFFQYFIGIILNENCRFKILAKVRFYC